MPASVNMNGPVPGKVTTQKIIEGKLLADSLLDDILSHLHDIDRTHLGVLVMLQVISRTPAIQRMTSTFFNKIIRDCSYLTTCSEFQKRMLLFSIVECLFTGEDLNVRYTPQRCTPLETILQRLSDVSIACEKIINQDKFCEIWNNTVKQMILIFLKNNQPVEASRILVINRNRLVPEHEKILEILINQYSESENVVGELVQQPEHDYSAYFAAMSDFLKDLNAGFEETTLRKLANKIDSDCHNAEADGPERGDDSDREEQTESSEGGQPASVHDAQAQSERPNSEPDAEQISASDSAEEQISVVNRSVRTQSDDESERSNGGAKNVDSIAPKMSLAYRLKKQSHRSGISIPCQYIVELCRQVNHEEENKENTGFLQSASDGVKQKTPAPIRGSAPGKATLVKHRRPRNYLLGERFEDLNTTLRSPLGSERSYSVRKKLSFTLELDSYIIAGCRRFAVGQWSQILSAFPFPENCTNMKIKDRFRNLIKMNYIAILDDGDFSVLNNELKSKIHDATMKLKQHGKSSKKPPRRSAGSVTSRLNQQSESSKSPRFERRKPPNNIKRKKNSTLSGASFSKKSSVMSTSSVEEEPRETTKPRNPKFTPTEDAYLLCGARHLGLRWNILKEYFDFQSHITPSDMQDRWDTLISRGKIEVPDEDGSDICCRDPDLENRCKDVTNKLKKKIQKQRKSFADAMENEDTVDSESSPSSIRSPTKSPSKRRIKLRVEESSESDIDIEDMHVDERHSSFKEPEPVASRKLNTSTDAGTQTNRSKFALRKRSPSLLDGESSSSASEPEQCDANKKGFQAGSPTRPSMINLFKRERRGKRRRRESAALLVTEVRERRQRELSRKQRRKVPIKKTMWTDVQIKELIKGLKKHGPGKWSRILDDGYDLFKDRTSVMIKDKFRNMIRQGLITDEMIATWNAERPQGD